MKRIFPLLTIVISGLLFQTNIQAQNLPIKLGLKVSPNLSWMAPETKHYNYNGVTGGAIVGLVSDFYFAENYAFSTGFNFAFLNGKLTYGDQLFESNDTIPGQLDRKYKFIYLDIPYMIKLQTREFGHFSFFGQIGFSTGFRISAKARDEFKPDDGSDVLSENSNITSKTALIREAILFGIGLEYHLDQDTRIFVGASYSNSLNNVLTGTNSRYGLNEKALLDFVELNLGILF
ncbi:MAG: porin family protein [bacterium]